MPRTKTVTVYQFNELSSSAKERARDWWREGALDYDWSEYTYKDAENVGLKLDEFDLDRLHIKGKFLGSAIDCADSILREHGKDCETYKLAKKFHDNVRQAMENDPEDPAVCFNWTGN